VTGHRIATAPFSGTALVRYRALLLYDVLEVAYGFVSVHAANRFGDVVAVLVVAVDIDSASRH
jgi:hypothetical protein